VAYHQISLLTPMKAEPAACLSEVALTASALALGARRVAGWSRAEKALAAAARVPGVPTDELRRSIEGGLDPLGQQFCRLRTPADRRPLGATYTPFEIVDFMVSWAEKHGSPRRIVDPGAGSGRFLLRAARKFPQAELVAVEIDPVAAIVCRGNLAAAGLADRSRVILADYRSLHLPEIEGTTLYIGNPPYVRHHLVPPEWKRWLVTEAAKKGYRSSQLAGLHAYFFLATAIRARPGDYGAFITAAEWLDVNYGKLIRDLFLDRLGGLGILILEPSAAPFPDAAATGAITTFRIEARPETIRFRRVESLADLADPGEAREIRREQLAAEQRWSHLSRAGRRVPEGHVELGELFRVHRGQVTGANRIWIAGAHSRDLPSSVLFPAVTKARELLGAGLALTDFSHLKRVIDLPPDLSVLSEEERRAVNRFLKLAKSAGADQTYIARNRKAWWSVGLKEPAPILATYMARRPPAFVRNLARARHINICHGLYPRGELTEGFLSSLVKYLARNVTVAGGRTYAGGLTKFEPREMERISIPAPELIADLAG
jgi:adenine-specific DNA-methyltransferase